VLASAVVSDALLRASALLAEVVLSEDLEVVQGAIEVLVEEDRVGQERSVHGAIQRVSRAVRALQHLSARPLCSFSAVLSARQLLASVALIVADRTLCTPVPLLVVPPPLARVTASSVALNAVRVVVLV